MKQINYNPNKSLFWNGFWANVKIIFGIMTILFGIMGYFIKHWIFLILGFIVGIFLIAKGSSQRFDYKMQSGTIIHGGDW